MVLRKVGQRAGDAAGLDVYKRQLLGSVLLVEGLTTLVTAYVAWYVYTLYKRAKKHAQAHGAPL